MIYIVDYRLGSKYVSDFGEKHPFVSRLSEQLLRSSLNILNETCENNCLGTPLLFKFFNHKRIFFHKFNTARNLFVFADFFVRIQENTDQKSSKYGYFPRSVIFILGT